MSDLVLTEYGNLHGVVALVIIWLMGVGGGVAARLLNWRIGWMLVLSCVLAGVAVSLFVLVPMMPIRGEASIALFFIPIYVVVGAGVALLGFPVGWYRSAIFTKSDDRTRCEQCGYSLRGLTGDPIRCPECGMVQQTEPGAES